MAESRHGLPAKANKAKGTRDAPDQPLRALIEQVARGVVRFALPEFRAYVREELGD
jgi:hypothetical protein